MRRLLPALLCLLTFTPAWADDKTDAVNKLIPWLLEEKETFKGISFAEVIAATSGKKVIAIDPKDAADQRVLAQLGTALDAVLTTLNAADSPTRSVKRINEMSAKFENAILAQLRTVPGLECTIPPTAAGGRQRSGYPDLRLLDKATGRVFYLDPKLYAKGTRAGALRTFYFEPKRETNKVNDDARHLLIGIEHERDAADTVAFVRWELVDLSGLRVRLKAEFEASNADVYRPEASVGASRPRQP